MSTFRLGLNLGIASILTAATLSLAHVDDPKIRDLMPRYEGPGWRAGGGDQAANGGPPVDFPAVGVQLRSWIPLPEFAAGASSGNDCWGYTSPAGNEYALIGMSTATAFVDVTDPADAQIVAVIDGPDSLWRDVKTYQQFAYVVSEGGGGIQVFDLSDIDNGNVTLAGSVTAGGALATHNVAIDTDSGFLYRCGGGSSSLGLRIYDLSEPANPTLVAEWHDRYSHDAQAVTYQSGPYKGKQIVFSFGGFNNGFEDPGVTVLDVTDKDNITVLSNTSYENAAFAHQGWVSPDRQHLYLNDELDESNFGTTTTTRIFDISDLANPEPVGTFSTGLPSVDHNLYFKDDLIFEANYRSGLRVFYAADPLNPVEIAHFDTFPENDSPSFNGLWSNYPFFESGTIIGSDLEKGLFVWKLDELSLVQFDLPSGPPEFIAPSGQSINVEITAPLGELDPDSPKLIVNAGKDQQVVSLTPTRSGAFAGEFPAIACGTNVEFYFEAKSTVGTTFTLPASGANEPFEALAAFDADILFEDDGQTDLGYTVSGNANDGQWELGAPVNFQRGDPPSDFDGSGQCWLTDNEPGNSDVDGGTTVLTGPAFSAPEGSTITYAYWLNDIPGGPIGPEDSMTVEIATNSAGTNWQVVRSYDTVLGAWRTDSIEVGSEIPASETIRLRFSVSDLDPGNVIEAGVDAIRVINPVCDQPIPGDIDENGVVDVDDLLALLGAWGACGDCPEDIDDSGAVDVSDLLTLLSNWT